MSLSMKVKDVEAPQK